MTATEWGAMWGLLNERFGQDRSAELAGFYLTELAVLLTDQQIKAGVRKTLISGRFFPSPEEIMAAAGLSSEASALAEWDECQSMMEGSEKAYDRLSETGKKMVRLLGGKHTLRNIPLDSVPFIRKEWLKLYADASEIDAHERTMLAPMSAEGRKLLNAAIAGEAMPDSRGCGLMSDQRGVEMDGSAKSAVRGVGVGSDAMVVSTFNEGVLMAREFYEPADEVVVLIPGARWVSLADLHAAGIDTGAPFLVWADRTGGAVYARQTQEHMAADPARLFAGRVVTGSTRNENDDTMAAYDEGFTEGRQGGLEEAAQEDAA